MHGHLLLHCRFDLQPGVKPKVGSGDRDEALTGLLANFALEGIGPQWTRPRPPILPVQDGEVREFCFCRMFDLIVCLLV